MSGRVSMMLGPFGFEAIGFGYEGVSIKLNTQWADVPVAQTFNQQQWTGPTSEEVTIKGVLFPLEHGGQSSLNGISSAAKNGTPMMLVSGDIFQGLVHGMYTIQSVDEDKAYITASGSARKNTYSITLKRYGQGSSGLIASGGVSSLLSLFG